VDRQSEKLLILDRALDRFGASEVEVNLLTSPALGDSECVYEVSWIG